MKVLFGICTISSKLSVATVVSMENTNALLDKEGIEHDTIYICGKSPVSSARGDLIGIFNKLDHTDLFLIDDDMKFPAEAVLEILKRPEWLVGGTYPIKDELLWHYAGVVETEDGVPVGKDGLLLAKNVAGGFMRIKRKGIEKMIEAYPDTRYIEYGREAWNLFGTYIEGTYLWGDDYSFCNRWNKIGGQCWILPDIDFGHIGSKTYSGNFHKMLVAFGNGKLLFDNVDAGISGWMIDSELETLRTLVSEVEDVVEVGCWKGRSTKLLLENCKGTVYAVDHFQGSPADGITEAIAKVHNVENEFMANVGHYENLEILKGSSVEMAKTFNGNKVDMVFIDAGHTYEECKADIETWLPKTKKIIAGHDYCSQFQGVVKAVDEKFNKVNVVDSIWWVDLTKEV